MENICRELLWEKCEDATLLIQNNYSALFIALPAVYSPAVIDIVELI